MLSSTGTTTPKSIGATKETRGGKEKEKMIRINRVEERNKFEMGIAFVFV